MRMTSQSWGWTGIDAQVVTVALVVKPSLTNAKGEALKNIAFVSMQILLFPFDFLQNIIIKQTNTELKKNRSKETDPGKFLTFLGIWLFMSYFLGFKRENYFSTKLVSIGSGAPYRFKEFMAGKRFRDLNRYLCFTDREAPSYQDKFWEVWQMIVKWNENMKG